MWNENIASCSSVSRWTFTKVHSVKDQATATVITRVWITWIALTVRSVESISTLALVTLSTNSDTQSVIFARVGEARIYFTVAPQKAIMAVALVMAGFIPCT